MHIILISGGAGRRLWPMSDADHPKQTLKLLPGPDGQPCSMAQRVFGQLEAAGLAQSAVICAGRAQRPLIKAQLPGAELAEEPSQRDTFPAVALACAYLANQKGAKPDEAVVVIPIDPYVDEAYFAALKCLPFALERSGAEVVLMGKRPVGAPGAYAYILPDCKDGCPAAPAPPPAGTRPSANRGAAKAADKYGYILPECRSNGFMRVAGFREKPDKTEAAVLIDSGALWNMGVFCFQIGLMAEKLKPYGLPLRYETLYEQYDRLPALSFDRAVLEKSPNLAAVPFEGMWRDLGTWNELVSVLPPCAGNDRRHASCRDTYIVNRLGIPVVTIGTRDLIVVATENGILITARESAPLVKEIAPE